MEVKPGSRCHRKRSQKLRHFIGAFNVACFIGFIIHIATISYTYFEYSTNINVQQSIQDALEAPKLAICIRYSDLIKGNSLNLTIRQIFALTPPENETIMSCGLRDNLTNRIDFKDRQGCRNLLKIRKFYTQQFICYSISQANRIEYLIEMVAHSIKFAYNFFNIRLSSAFDNMNIVLPIAYYGEAPFLSRTFSSYYFFEKRKSSTDPGYVSVKIGFDLVAARLLEAPYDTKCQRNMRKYHCVRNCMRREMAKFNLAPASEMHFDPIDMRHVTDEDLKNPTLGPAIVQAEVRCLKLCYSSDCNFNYSITHTVIFFEKEEAFDRFFKVDTPQRPITKLVADPRVTFEQFFIYITSLMGVWFGLSVAAMNPFKSRLVAKLMTPCDVVPFKTHIHHGQPPSRQPTGDHFAAAAVAATARTQYPTPFKTTSGRA